VFGALAFEVQTSAALRQWDLSTAQALHAAAQNIPSPLVEYVIFGFFLGREVLILLVVVLALYFLHQRFWREFLMLVIGSGGGGLLWYFLSNYFGRPRPPTQIDVVLSDPSFPSGHTLSAIVFYGFLAYLLVPRMPSRFWKWFVAILLTFVTGFIGYSRLILGGHYVTDIIAGYALGIAWAGLVYTAIEVFFPRDTSVTSSIAEASSTRNTLPGLRTPGLFKRRPILGVILILGGGLSFVALGYNLLIHGPLLQVDTTVYKDLITEAKTSASRTDLLMTFGFFIGKQVILVLVTLLSVYFAYKHYWRELAMLLISSAGGSVVWDFVVNYFGRPRPADQTGLAVTNIPSFPSGHTMSAIIGYGFLAYLLIPKMPSRGWKWAVAIAAVLIMLFSGFSRIFQGSHYLTDVLGGYALGLAWAALVYTLIEGIFIRKGEVQNVEKR
jgi:undecaprenyl-diphosphatase